MHLNEDLAVIETEQVGPGRFVPVVTDLYRQTQAVIRYRLEDVLVEGSSCDCGSPLRVIERIEGRQDDVLRLSRAGTATVAVFADLVRGAVLGAEGVRDFTATQDAADRIVLTVDPEDRWEAAAVSLRAALATQGVSPTLVAAPYTPPDPTAKRRRVRRSG
jgi:phenylacetate-coenzyme A ligase PaaK-like adenylate-forming protein